MTRNRLMRDLMLIGAEIVLLMKEYRRALTLLHQLDDLLKSVRQPTDRVKLKLAKCYMALQDNAAAIKELRSIPSKLRTCQVNVLLGRLLKFSGHKEQAASCLKAAAQELPIAVEVIEDLVDLGVNEHEIEGTEISDGSMEFGKGLFASLSSRRDSDFARCIEGLDVLNRKYPNHPLIMGELSISLVQADRMQMVILSLDSLVSYIADDKQYSGSSIISTAKGP